MNIKPSLLATAMLAFASTTASAAGPGQDSAWGFMANRIAGVYTTQAQVRPCGSSLPFSPVANTLTFNAGGTVTENAPFPPDGIPNVYGVPGNNKRSFGLGKWSYNFLTHKYSMTLRFDWFVDNAYNGYQVVEREILLSNDGRQATGPVHTTRYALDGSIVADLCGTAVSTRW